MNNELEIQSFIKSNPNIWEDLLTSSPYFISVSRDHVCNRNLMLLKYSQLDTIWNKAGKIAREARGIVLDEDTLEVVNYGFDKFFNSGEPYADKIDAISMKSTTKIDGSILKIRLFKDGELLISTNGTIDAFKAPVASQPNCKFDSFGGIVKNVIVNKFGSLDQFKTHLDSDKTYIFEMVSPWTRVVTPYHENDMYLIGCRSLDPSKSYGEIPFWECPLAKFFKTPEILDFSSIGKCLEYAQTLDWTSEGFVVVDKNFHRVKVKNAAWLSVHHLCQNHIMSYRRALEIVKANEIDEVVAYFPEFKDALLKVKDDYFGLIRRLDDAWNRYLETSTDLGSRKDQALSIKREFGKLAGAGFSFLDKKCIDGQEYVSKMPLSNLVKMLGYKDQKNDEEGQQEV